MAFPFNMLVMPVHLPAHVHTITRKKPDSIKKIKTGHLLKITMVFFFHASVYINIYMNICIWHRVGMISLILITVRRIKFIRSQNISGICVMFIHVSINVYVLSQWPFWVINSKSMVMCANKYYILTILKIKTAGVFEKT